MLRAHEGPATVVVVTRDGPLVFQLPGCKEANGQAAGLLLPARGELAESIREALASADKPIKLSVLAVRVNHELTSHFRGTVRRMVRGGEVLTLPGYRYWSANRPLAE
jgi:hypothetical protein